MGRENFFANKTRSGALRADISWAQAACFVMSSPCTPERRGLPVHRTRFRTHWNDKGVTDPLMVPLMGRRIP